MEKSVRDVSADICGLHVREDGGEQSRVVEGRAVVFGRRSKNLTPRSYREVYEIMEPGSITMQTVLESDVFLTAYHNNDIVLGRCENGKGTLELIPDAEGMRIRCELPATQDGDTILELIRRGDLHSMSFAFTANEDDSENHVSYERTSERGADGKEVWLRHVKKVEKLYDVTIARRPAYEDTSVGLREQEDTIDKAISKAVDDASEREEKARMAFLRERTIQTLSAEVEFQRFQNNINH